MFKILITHVMQSQICLYIIYLWKQDTRTCQSLPYVGRVAVITAKKYHIMIDWLSISEKQKEIGYIKILWAALAMTLLSTFITCRRLF